MSHTIFQKPNKVLILAATAWVLTFVFHKTDLYTTLAALAYGLSFAWGYQEAVGGVNAFRKSLGYGAMIALVVLVGIYH